MITKLREPQSFKPRWHLSLIACVLELDIRIYAKDKLAFELKEGKGEPVWLNLMLYSKTSAYFLFQNKPSEYIKIPVLVPYMFFGEKELTQTQVKPQLKEQIDFQELNDLVYKTESNEEKRALILIIRKLKGQAAPKQRLEKQYCNFCGNISRIFKQLPCGHILCKRCQLQGTGSIRQDTRHAVCPIPDCIKACVEKKKKPEQSEVCSRCGYPYTRQLLKHHSCQHLFCRWCVVALNHQSLQKHKCRFGECLGKLNKQGIEKKQNMLGRNLCKQCERSMSYRSNIRCKLSCGINLCEACFPQMLKKNNMECTVCKTVYPRIEYPPEQRYKCLECDKGLEGLRYTTIGKCEHYLHISCRVYQEEQAREERKKVLQCNGYSCTQRIVLN